MESSVLGYFSSLPEALDSVIFFPHDSGWSLCQSQVGFLEGQDPIAPVQCLAQRGHAHLEEHLPPHPTPTHTITGTPEAALGPYGGAGGKPVKYGKIGRA